MRAFIGALLGIALAGVFWLVVLWAVGKWV